MTITGRLGDYRLELEYREKEGLALIQGEDLAERTFLRQERLRAYFDQENTS